MRVPARQCGRCSEAKPRKVNAFAYVTLSFVYSFAHKISEYYAIVTTDSIPVRMQTMHPLDRLSWWITSYVLHFVFLAWCSIESLYASVAVWSIIHNTDV